MEPFSLVFGDGFRLSGGILGFDSPGAGLSFVSSAEIPAAWKVRKPLCSELTAGILRAVRREFRPLVMPFGRPTEIGAMRVTLLPAGPMPGSAVAVVEYGGRRMIYCRGLPDGGARIPSCDLLAVHVSPVGGPSAQEFSARLVGAAGTAIAAGMTPVIRSNSFGGALSVCQTLAAAGIAIRQHSNSFRFNKVWESRGCATGLCRRLGASVPSGAALLLPLHMERSSVEALVKHPWRIGVLRPGEDAGSSSFDEVLTLPAALAPEHVGVLARLAGAGEIALAGPGADVAERLLSSSGARVTMMDRGRQCALELI